MKISRLIYDTTTKKLADFKDVNEYISSYSAAFNKVVGLLTNSFHYTCKSIKMYFQIIILINIKTKYSALVLSI